MACALFGKLPAKRDFIAVNMPRELLRFWEVWLQGAISGSMQSLGPGWRDAYLAAPIWRFWLGRSHVGAEVMGAFMPSLDGVGRYFPLAVMALAPQGEAFAPPSLDPQDAWFEGVEGFLLDTLEPDAAYDQTLKALESLALPATVAPDSTPIETGLFGVADDGAGGGIVDMIARLDTADQGARRAGGSYWWTIGGEKFPALVLRAATLPEAHHFATLLTGPERPTVVATPPADDDETVSASSIGAEL